MVSRVKVMPISCIGISWLACALVVQPTGVAAQVPDENGQAEIEVSLLMPQKVLTRLPCIAEVRIANRTATVVFPPTEELLALPEEDRRTLFYQDGLSRLELPEYSLLSNQPPPISVEITRRMKRVVGPEQPCLLAFYVADWRHIHTPEGNAPRARFRRPHITVASGDSKTFLVDLAPWVNTLPRGDYQLTLYVHPDWNIDGWASNTVAFSVRTLEAGKWAAIRHAAPGLRKNQPESVNRFDWLNAEINCSFLHEALPEEVWRSLALYCFLGGSMKAEPDAELPVELLDSLPDHLQALGGVLLYESLLAKGDEVGAAELRSRLIEERPDLTWQLDRAKKGDGLIQQAIRLTKPTTPQKEGESPSGKEDGRDGNDEP